MIFVMKVITDMLHFTTKKKSEIFFLTACPLLLFLLNSPPVSFLVLRPSRKAQGARRDINPPNF